METFALELVKRLASSTVNVVTQCTFWKPVKILWDPEIAAFLRTSTSGNNSNDQPLHNLDKCTFIGRAMNQYFFQRRLTRTNNATLWLCFDVLTNKMCCIKAYHINSCTRERSIRAGEADMEVISVLDKVIDEILHHASVTNHPGVSNIREVIVSVEDDLLYMVMDYYPAQLLSYDVNREMYNAPIMETDGSGSGNKREKHCLYLYKEQEAKIIIKDLVKSVQYLHSLGIIHKDLKPENILLTHVNSSMYEAVSLPPYDESADSDSNSLSDDSETSTIGISTKDREYIKEFIMANVGLYCDVQRDKATETHFPYQPAIDTSFDWQAWDESQLICDTVMHDPVDKGGVSIGKSSRNFANTLVQTLRKEASSLIQYFLIGERDSLRYNKNALLASAASNLKAVDVDLKSHDCEESQVPSVVITDFGVSSLGKPKQTDRGDLAIYDAEGTTAFTSPECLMHIEGGIPGKARDIFSIGVVLYTMIYGKLPYSGKGSIELVINMLNAPLTFPAYRTVSPPLQDLLQGMMHRESDKRYDAERVLKHEWLLTG